MFDPRNQRHFRRQLAPERERPRLFLRQSRYKRPRAVGLQNHAQHTRQSRNRPEVQRTKRWLAWLPPRQPGLPHVSLRFRLPHANFSTSFRLLHLLRGWGLGRDVIFLSPWCVLCPLPSPAPPFAGASAEGTTCAATTPAAAGLTWATVRQAQRLALLVLELFATPCGVAFSRESGAGCRHLARTLTPLPVCTAVWPWGQTRVHADYRPPISGHYGSTSWQSWFNGGRSYSWNAKNDGDLYEVYIVKK
jgi:hypothetical protein